MRRLTRAEEGGPELQHFRIGIVTWSFRVGFAAMPEGLGAATEGDVDIAVHDIQIGKREDCMTGHIAWCSSGLFLYQHRGIQ